MKRITFSADERVIELARRTAKSQGRKLGQAFREWLGAYANRAPDASSGKDLAKVIDEFYKRIAYVDSGGVKMTREERNQR